MTIQSAQPAQASQSPQSEQATQPDIIYTWTDKTPMLAAHSFLSIVRGFTQRADVSVSTADISLAGRILVAFSPTDDDLARLGELTQSPVATIIKLSNIPASPPQLRATIIELQTLGHRIPDYPDSPAAPAKHKTRTTYNAVEGSTVNPVLREGSSDRRALVAVEAYARSHPHSMGAWSPQSRTHVATMGSGDFRCDERNVVVPEAGTLQIHLRPADDSEPIVLRESPPVTVGEVVDATFMSAAALDEFLAQQVSATKDEDLLLSVHLKAMMMRVSDPVIFGHAARAALPGISSAYGRVLARAGLRAKGGLASILAGLGSLSQDEQIRAAIEAELAAGPRLSMVDSDRGITNLHVFNDVIIDASVPAMIRAGDHLWRPDGQTANTLTVIPNSSYIGVYQAVVDDCRAHGALDPATTDSMPDVGPMARRAEEYGSHDKTFLIPADGIVEVITVEGAGIEPGTVLLSHRVATGDIWQACTTQNTPIRDWIYLAVTRTRAANALVVFWLDSERGHDAVLIDLANRYLADENIEGLDIRVPDPVAATYLSLECARRGKDTISITGSALRDYSTGLFPTLELGMGAKMLSVMPLVNGNGLYEAEVRGSAPRHVRQLLEEDHLRWDSPGEFLALAETFHHMAQVSGNERAEVPTNVLKAVTARLLEENHSPTRRLGQIDSRGLHAQLALYWVHELAAQETSPEPAAVFSPIAQQPETFNDTIQAELLAVQGSPVDIDGYYRPDTALTDIAMWPSTILNAVVEALT